MSERNLTIALILALFSLSSLLILIIRRIIKLEGLVDTLTEGRRISPGLWPFTGTYNRLSAVLRESSRALHALTEAVPDAVFELDTAGRIRYMNRGAMELTGYTEDDVKGRYFSEIVDQKDPGFDEYLKNMLHGEKNHAHEFKLVLKDRRLNVFELSGVPIHRGGVVRGCYIIGKDIEGVKKLSDDLKAVKKEASETSDKLRKTIEDLEGFALMAVRRELKMQEIRERFKELREGREPGKEARH